MSVLLSREGLCRDLGLLVKNLTERPGDNVICFKYNDMPYVTDLRNAWMDFFAAQGIHVGIAPPLKRWGGGRQRERKKRRRKKSKDVRLCVWVCVYVCVCVSDPR